MRGGSLYVFMVWCLGAFTLSRVLTTGQRRKVLGGKTDMLPIVLPTRCAHYYVVYHNFSQCVNVIRGDRMLYHVNVYKYKSVISNAEM